MPKRTDLHSILLIGSGPIVIGQACEFDYSGTQACKALKEEGYRVVLVNSNPATIMTDPEFADRTYVEPLTVEAINTADVSAIPAELVPPAADAPAPQPDAAMVRLQVPTAKIIGFPRGAGSNLRAYVENVGVDAVGLDWMVDLDFARDQIQRIRPVQGNLDPLALRAGGAALDRSIDAILAALAAGPFIFNLGHGILPDTPIAHVEQMLKRVRS